MNLQQSRQANTVVNISPQTLVCGSICSAGASMDSGKSKTTSCVTFATAPSSFFGGAHPLRRAQCVRTRPSWRMKGGDEGAAKDKKAELYRQRLLDITSAETALSNPHGLKMSHQVVRFDEDGLADRDRFLYVEERDCIGCTHCQTTAPGTFFMEEDHGRARVFNQVGNIEELQEVAIDTCPVNCIYYVNWRDLVNLEEMRRFQVINNMARLVGGQDLSRSKVGDVKTEVMDSGIVRCEDCPGRGCSVCPMYGVGKNPQYIRKKALREEKKKERKRHDKSKTRRRL